ncbi:Os10g0121766 [Oryza sativa Japonica Group]|uniref:Os10g0121766 protein n=1 Tax=Oryza sativa subsp. japonica TaxID=39947 RepID=A0A0P0XR85_ORYSJ|nr:Os10g0121766 [Oryza sativa Japonica Group]
MSRRRCMTPAATRSRITDRAGGLLAGSGIVAEGALRHPRRCCGGRRAQAARQQPTSRMKARWSARGGPAAHTDLVAVAEMLGLEHDTVPAFVQNSELPLPPHATPPAPPVPATFAGSR